MDWRTIQAPWLLFLLAAFLLAEPNATAEAQAFRA